MIFSFNTAIGCMRMYMITSVIFHPWFSLKFCVCQTRMFLFFWYSINNSSFSHFSKNFFVN
jgi:hypothetical protein